MKRGAVRLLLLPAVLVLALPSAAQAATCEVYRQPLAFATDAVVEMTVLSGRDCRIRYPDEELFEIRSNDLTGRPLHGGARVQGKATAYYRSNPGYKGRDHFAFTLCGENDGKSGCTRVMVKVQVR